MGPSPDGILQWVFSQRYRTARIITLVLLTLALSFLHISPGEATLPMPGCQCTDFVYSQRPDLPRTMGRARDFLYSSRIHRFPYDQVPQVGDVAVFLRGEFGFSARLGHVALVVDVNESMDRFSVVGWDGLKADCILEIFQDLPVTSNTYFIHHKEPVSFQTLPLEEWIALAEEDGSQKIESHSACTLIEYEGSELGTVCSGDLSCCNSNTASIPLTPELQIRRSALEHLRRVKSPLE